MRYRYYAVVQDLAGNVVSGASVSVYLAGTTTPANVYTSPSGGTGNSTPPQLTTGQDGVVEFWLEHSEYSYGQLFKLVVESGSLSKTIDNVQIINWATTPYTVDATGASNNQVVVFNVTAQKLQAGVGVYITNAGDVGIGTITPSQKLTVVGNIGIQAGANAFIGTLDNYALSLRTNNTDRVFIDSSGNVGIGTTAPEALLDLRGLLRFTPFIGGGGETRADLDVITQDTTTYAWFTLFRRTNTTGEKAFVMFKGDGTLTIVNKLSVNGDSYITGGNLGIGTTAPAQKLDVVGNVKASGQFISTVATGTAPLSVSSTTVCINLNADMLDAFHASQTPAPNVIVPLNASGILDLSATSALINAYTIRRVNGDNLTADYSLAVGEEVIYKWNTTASLSKPLYIATNNGIFMMIIIAPYQTAAEILGYLNPNNTTYSNAFTHALAEFVDGGTGPGGGSGTYSNFSLANATSGGITVCFISTVTNSKFLIAIQRITKYPQGGAVHIFGSRWNDTTTAWTSLGTLTTSRANGTITVLIRRLL